MHYTRRASAFVFRLRLAVAASLVLVHLGVLGVRVLKVVVIVLVLLVGDWVLGCRLGKVDDPSPRAAADHVVEVNLLQIVIVVVICWVSMRLSAALLLLERGRALLLSHTFVVNLKQSS